MGGINIWPLGQGGGAYFSNGWKWSIICGLLQFAYMAEGNILFAEFSR